MAKTALYVDPSQPLERIAMQLDAVQLSRLDSVALTRYGGNRALAARVALIIGLEVLEDPRTMGLTPPDALAAYIANKS